MKWVLVAALPGLAAQCYFFGWGTLIQVIFAILVAMILESVIMLLRKRSPKAALKDHSVIVTAWLLAVAIPPLSPWWILVIGLIFAVVIAKHLYGGLGQNPFNPAMVAYVVLLISFPLQMTSWVAPASLNQMTLSIHDAFSLIFTEFTSDGLSLQQVRSGFDGVSMATPLDTFKTAWKAGGVSSEIMQQPIFSYLSGLGWEWVNVAYLAGGLFLLRMRVIQWYIPVAFLSGLAAISGLFYLTSGQAMASPLFHLFSGATMLGAFFIATDPVTASTTVKGRLIFGALIGMLVFTIRTWGGFPDGVAFSVLIANMAAPLLDTYTKPKTYGH